MAVLGDHQRRQIGATVAIDLLARFAGSDDGVYGRIRPEPSQHLGEQWIAVAVVDQELGGGAHDDEDSGPVDASRSSNTDAVGSQSAR